MTVSHNRNSRYPSLSVYSWRLTDSDGDGDSIGVPQMPDRTVQVVGVFNGGSVTLQGSNQDEPTDWSTLHDPSGSDLTFSSAGIEAIAENPLHIRPVFSGAAGAAAVDVIIVSKGK